MQLFADNLYIEGITSTNACYGGTEAFFNTIDWVTYYDSIIRLKVVHGMDVME